MTERILRHRSYDPDVEKVVPKDALAVNLKGHKVVRENAIVLDPASLVVLDFLAEHPTSGPSSRDVPRLAFRLAREIREQIEPARIPEPGWGERVLASVEHSSIKKRRPFVHAYDSPGIGSVWTDGNGFHAAWSDLLEPVLIREGVEP